MTAVAAKRAAVLCGALAVMTPLLAQPVTPPRCMSVEHAQFDFWVGAWTVQWTNPDGSTGAGINRIRRSHDGCVIVEEFDGRPGTPLIGTSLSVLDSATRRWRQTWADNTGAYLTFEGGWETDATGRSSMTLSRRAMVRGSQAMQRMLFRDIGANALVWDWQSSADEGATWSTTWQIRYTRREK